MKSKHSGTFTAQAFLESAGLAKKIVEYRRGEVIFTQGDSCDHVLYIQKGGVKLSVLSKAGREAVVAMLGPGEFFGEGCLAGQSVRMGSATATTDSAILLVDKDHMVRLLHKQHALSDRFIAHMLARNIRIEQELLDELHVTADDLTELAEQAVARVRKTIEQSRVEIARARLLAARNRRH